MGIEMVYGTLAGLARLSPDWFAMPLPTWAIIALALLHGAPFTVLLFLVSMLVLHSNRDTTQVVDNPYVIVRDIAEQQQEMARQMQAMSNYIERLSTPALTDDTPHMDTVDDPGRAYLDSLAVEYGSLTKAAEAMGVKRQTLYNRANKLKEVER
jgi:DNA-binding NtrC family response regulator